MKKFLVLAVIALGAVTANAQAVEQPGFFDNWSMGLDGGVTTPMNNAPFWRSMRGLVGLHIDKQITPAFAMGVEGQFGVNTSSWAGRIHSSTAFDNSYVGLYGAVDLFNLLGGYKCNTRVFNIEAVAGAGWGHDYIRNNHHYAYWNYFATKAGLNFNFNVSKCVTIAIKPSVVWNMTDGQWARSSCAYDVRKATFNLQAGLTFHFGKGFNCVKPYNQAEIDALNGQINDLRSALDACLENANNLDAKAKRLAEELEACKNKKPVVEVVKEVSDKLSSVRYIFFKVGKYNITADQQPNVEMIADYMKNHPASKVVIKGYASPEGSLELNEKLAKDRANAVKNMLVSKYKIAADRIVAEGEGIGHMFEENSWNRVSICTLEEGK